ncbi:MAG: ABC transporter ATP-binding protein [Parasporobacterium sp.]|nr:ABC transporter ATP-binding protein [Parasporobacterium sp.]
MLLELTDICKDYPQGKDWVRILKDVSLTVEKGEYIAIMGPSGSGKSTLMNVIGCLDVPTSGTYILKGRDIGNLNDNQLSEVRNNEIGFVFQQFHLLPKMDAQENVALPLLYRGVPKAERLKKAAEALEMVGLGDRMNFKPNQLSGGQCQRVAIARAMVGEPEILLADEPTGALDTASGSQIMDIFDEIHEKGSTIIMITHEPDVAKRAEKIYYIRDGQISGGDSVNE